MYEDIGSILSKGFDTWKRNLNIALPFVFSAVISVLLLIAMLALIFAPLMSSIDPSALLSNPDNAEEAAESIASAIEGNIGTVIGIALIFALAFLLVYTFFTAGAIGMAKDATEKGKTTLNQMLDAGKKHYMSLFLAQILMMIVLIVGILILMIPLVGLASGGEPSIATFISIILMIIYVLLASLALAVVPYALVVDNMGPIDAIKAGVAFFLSNKMDVFLVLLVIAAISLIFGFIGALFTGSEIATIVWQILSSVISIVVIQPLSTIWWTRLYMNRTGKMGEGDLHDREDLYGGYGDSGEYDEGVKYL